MNPPHIVEAQQKWYPEKDSHWQGLPYLMVPHEEVYWADCARAENFTQQKRPFGACYEDVFIPHNDPEFEPILSPMRMIWLGIFGNAYFGSLRDTTTYPLGKERWDLFPPHALIDDFPLKAVDKADWKNGAFFKKKASSTREWWMERKLISNIDPLGWFEWYCWYWMGRRIPIEDTRQIDRWKKFGLRHIAMLERNPRAMGQKQALLHWSCDAWACD